MQYIDCGSRDPAQALGAWLQKVLTPSVAELRSQSGFFTAEALGFLTPTLQRLATNNHLANLVIGSNEPGTQRDDVLQLAQLLGLPRTNGHLGIVRYSNAYFHPKTYHVRRDDGSQAAYVGSANFTAQSVTALHVDAGMILDTRDGDPADVLNQIANAVDQWFTSNRDGLHLVSDSTDIDRLVADGVLAVAPPPRPPTSGPASGTGGSGTPAPRLRPLVSLPRLPGAASPPAPATPATTPAPTPAVPAHLSVNRATFPAHVLFDPTATGPTTGTTAISGRPLPGGAVGIIIRLSRDETRVFAGGVGTANINLPVDSIPPLRFGILGRGGYPARPRAEFDLFVRYLGSRNIVLPDAVESNVMLYGYLNGETGHQNRRMLLPADVRTLGDQITQAGLSVPAPGHLALLEWPTLQAPEFRLTFLEPNSTLAQRAQQIFTTATNAQHLLADNACGLPSGVSPPW